MGGGYGRDSIPYDSGGSQLDNGFLNGLLFGGREGIAGKIMQVFDVLQAPPFAQGFIGYHFKCGSFLSAPGAGGGEFTLVFGPVDLMGRFALNNHILTASNSVKVGRVAAGMAVSLIMDGEGLFPVEANSGVIFQ